MPHLDPANVRLSDGPAPADWAEQLAHALDPALPPSEASLLAARSVDLGGDVRLAHLRSAAVAKPCLAVWRASVGNVTTWHLLIVALMPQDEPVRHLGWLAHLATALHDPNTRAAMRFAASPTELAAVVDEVLTAGEAGRRRPSSPSLPHIARHRLVIAILKRDETVEHLLSLFVQHGIQGATIIEARGMAEHLAAHTSLFAGFRSAFKVVGHSQIVLALVPADRAADVLDLVRLATRGTGLPGSGIAWAIDAPMVFGLDDSGES